MDSLSAETTIDRAGRVVIPAAIRARAGLRPGLKLRVHLDVDGVRIEPRVPPPVLVDLRGRTIIQPTMKNPPRIDVAAVVRAERDRWPL